jgi:hypothetical protein
MFRMHELKRRQVCRMAFVLVCLAPTLGAAAWGVSRRLPGHVAFYASELSELLDLSVSLGSVSHPRPGVTLYHDVAFTDRETGTQLARVRVLEVDGNSDPIILRASQIEIEAAHVPIAWRMVERQLRKGAACRLLASECTLRDSSVAQTFTDIDAKLTATGVTRDLNASFRPAGLQRGEPMMLRVECEIVSEATKRFMLGTQDYKLPIALVTAWADGLKGFGSRATFQGVIDIKSNNVGWEGTLLGELDHVDLDALVTAQLPHTLSGEARVQLERARIANGRIVEAKGTLTAGPGAISRSLLVSGSERLKLVSTAGGKETMLRYEKLDFGFTVDTQGLLLVGRCPGSAMLVDANTHALCSPPREQPQPLVGLVQMLVPANQHQVPATLESEWLIRHLPMPAIITPRTATQSPAGHLKR